LGVAKSIKSFGQKIEMLEYTGTYSVKENSVVLKLNESILLKRSISDVLNNSTQYDNVYEIKGLIQEDGGIKFDIFKYIIHWQYPANILNGYYVEPEYLVK